MRHLVPLPGPTAVPSTVYIYIVLVSVVEPIGAAGSVILIFSLSIFLADPLPRINRARNIKRRVVEERLVLRYSRMLDFFVGLEHVVR